MKNKFLFLLVFSFCFVSSVKAQKRNILIDHISVPGFINSTFVTSIEQDEYGMLWFGTSSGLYRYNGQRFEVYTYQSETSLPLSARQINQIKWDKKTHQLLVATRNMGLLAFNYKSNSLTLVAQHTEPLNAITITEDGRTWVVAPDGLFEFADSTLLKIGNASALGNPSALLALPGNELLVAGVKRVTKWKNGILVDTVFIDRSDKTYNDNTRITSLLIDRQNQLWLGTEKDGLLILDYATGQFIKEITPTQKPFYSRINHLLEDADGNIWILTKAEGIALYNTDNESIQFLRKDIFSQSAISSNNTYTAFQDKQKVIWLGTTASIDYYDPVKIKFEHYAHNPYNNNSISDNMVRSVYPVSDNEIWVGTDAGYLNILNRSTEKVERIRIEVKQHKIENPVVAFCFEPISENEILVGTSEGLLVMNKHVKSFSFYEPLKEYTKGKRLRLLKQKNNMLYGVCYGEFFMYNISAKKLYRLDLQYSPSVTAIQFDNQGELWIAILGKLLKLNKENAEILETKSLQDTTSILVLDIQPIDSGMLVSTMNHGVFSFNQNNGKIKQFLNVQNGLPDNTVYTTLIDKAGNIWVSSNRGIAKRDLRGSFILFDATEGVQSDEFNRTAYAITPGGLFVMAGINGLNVFNPSRIEVGEEHVQPFIESVEYDDVNAEEKRKNIHMLVGESKFELHAKNNSFVIQYGGSGFRRPIRYQLFYKLEKLDKNWKSNPLNQAVYHNVTPGEYTFLVKLVDTGGNEKITSVDVYVKPPIYLTWWFRLILSFVVIALAIVTYRLRIQSERRDRAKLEKLLAERTAQIEQSRQELAMLNEKKDLIFSILSHDLRSPLTTLKGFLSLLIDNVHEFSASDIKKHAEQMRGAVSNSLDLIDNTLFWSLSQMGSIQWKPEKIQVSKLIDRVKNLYLLTADKKKIQVEILSDTSIYVFADENMVFITLRNLFSNALKFTPEGGSISLRSWVEKDRVFLEVADSGIGMSAEYVRNLKARKQPELKKGTANEKGTGLGLLLCQQFLAANNGELQISSIEGKGSNFTMVLPVAEL
ncbi:MAG: ATP-binding protein [Cyclobacteriaceae bacterium]|nr:ATP-binding protein [Cytophagales bacterium]MCZ8329617.1 ATP-binding protein [Cyclobacteriaceae bacterium]